MGFFDDFSRAIGTDGSGGGAAIEIGKVLGTANSSSGLLNNPGVKEAAAAAAIVYGVPAGIEYFGGAAAGTAGAGATAAGLVPLEVVSPLGSSAVASVTAGGAAAGGLTLGGIANGALSALNTGAQIVGGINAIKSLTGGSVSTSRPVSTVQPVYAGSSGNADPLVYPQDTSQNNLPNNAGATPVVISAGASTESILTKLAAGLTVAAIIYQFSKGK